MATNWGQTSFPHSDSRIQQEFERVARSGNALSSAINAIEARVGTLEAKTGKTMPIDTKTLLRALQDQAIVEQDTKTLDFIANIDEMNDDELYDVAVGIVATRYVNNWVKVSGITNLEKIAKKIYYEVCKKFGKLAMRKSCNTPNLFVKLDNPYIPNHPKQTGGVAPFWSVPVHQRIAVNKGFDLELVAGYYKNIIAPKDGLYKLNYRWVWINGIGGGAIRTYQFVEADIYFKTHLIVNDITVNPECELDIVRHNDHTWQAYTEYKVGSENATNPLIKDYSWQTQGNCFVWLRAGDKVRVAIEYDVSTENTLSGSAFGTASYLLKAGGPVDDTWNQANGYIELHYIGNKAMKGIEYYV